MYYYHEIWKYPNKGKPELIDLKTGDKGLIEAKQFVSGAMLIDKNNRYKIMSWDVNQWTDYTGKLNHIAGVE